MAIGSPRKGALATCLSFPGTRSSTRILGRKRVAVPPTPASPAPHSPVRPLRKQRSTRLHKDGAVSLLESLPEDVLIKVLCKVSHGDLGQLLLVSKPVREATIVAKELHFSFATPSAKVGFRYEECSDDDERQWAPYKQRKVAGHLGGKDLAGIAVNLAAAFDSLMTESQ
nr:F-box protein [Cynodon dactylon]